MTGKTLDQLLESVEMLLEQTERIVSELTILRDHIRRIQLAKVLDNDKRI